MVKIPKYTGKPGERAFMGKTYEGIRLRKKIPEKIRLIWGLENTDKTFS